MVWYGLPYLARNVRVLAGSSFQATPTILTPSAFSAARVGASAAQGTHQEAKKLTSVVPFSAVCSGAGGAPSRPGRASFGAIEPTVARGITCGLWCSA